MLRGMVFVDHMNFDIALQQYYSNLGKQTPKLDYNIFFKELVSLIPNVDFVKAFLFIPKPAHIDSHVELTEEFFTKCLR